MKTFAIFLFSIVLLINSVSCAGRAVLKENLPASELKEPLTFRGGEKFSYEVRFNGIKVGKIDFVYQGRKEIDKTFQDIFVVSSNVNILKLFQIQSKESVYANVENYLPHRVEREVTFLGRKESILEEYNQREGWVKITVKKDKIVQERLIYQEPPIHNSLILFFIYPLNLEEKLGKTREFNLSLQKIKIKVKELRKIQTQEAIDEVYLLEVSNHRKSLVWIKKQERLPVKLEVPAFLGRVVITKK